MTASKASQESPDKAGNPGPSFLPTSQANEQDEAPRQVNLVDAAPPAEPVAPRTGALNRPVVVAVVLTVAVALVALAVHVWFLVAPPSPGWPVASTPGAGSPSSPVDPTADAGSPNWSLILTLATPKGASLLWPPAAADDSLLLLDWMMANGPDTAQGVDIANGKVLWSKQAGHVSGAAGNVAFLTSDHTTQVVDAHSGAVLISDIGKSRIVYQDSTTVVTVNADTLALCGRSTSAPQVCAWQAHGVGSGPVVFGDKWVNTDGGVLDVKTGLPAPSGADAQQGAASWPDKPGRETIFYAGSGDRFWRLESRAPKRWSSLSPYWLSAVDTSTGRSGTAVLIDQPHLDTWPLSHLYTSTFNGTWHGDAGLLSALDWGTKRLLWQAHLAGTISNLWEVGDVVMIKQQQAVFDIPEAAAVPPLTILDAKTGQQLWTGAADYLGTRNHAVYLESGGQLTAFDFTTKNGFRWLWHLRFPPHTYSNMVGQYVTATDTDSGQIWRLDHA